MEAERVLPIAFVKYHGLGNDYLVVEPASVEGLQLADFVRGICDRHYGVGGDGVLLGPITHSPADFGLRIFNPDGSEAEKSGNGLRIFARHLWETDQVGVEHFTVHVPGGIVSCQVMELGRIVRVQMGKASFSSADIPALGPSRQVLAETLHAGGYNLKICALNLGNPHCVVMDLPVTSEIAHRLGPLIETHATFPRRINVQFLQILDRKNLRIEIWERGAGYTLASGSSACAAANAAFRLGLCEAATQVHTPGGILQVVIAPDGETTLTGPVVKVSAGKYWP